MIEFIRSLLLQASHTASNTKATKVLQDSTNRNITGHHEIVSMKTRVIAQN